LSKTFVLVEGISRRDPFGTFGTSVGEWHGRSEQTCPPFFLVEECALFCFFIRTKDRLLDGPRYASKKIKVILRRDVVNEYLKENTS
jgi:hypothetical protein